MINRIEKNQAFIREGAMEKASLLQQRVKSIPEGRGSHEIRIEQPRITNYLVNAGEVNRPKAEIKLQRREIRGSGVERPEKQPAAPTERPERAAPARPRKAIKPPEKKMEEKRREEMPAQKQIEKPNEPRPTDKKW